MADPVSAYFQPTLEAAWLDLQLISADQLGLPTTDWTALSPERNILILNARMLEVLNVACIERYRGMFLGYSTGEPLTIIARETYNTPRLGATFATCEGEFSNSTLITYTIPAGDYVTVKKSTTDDIRYFADGPLSIGPGTTTVTIRAAAPGSAGSAIVGEIDEVEGNVLGGVSFANTSAATGRDDEADADLVPRARLAVTALSITGPDGAYEYFAKGGERNGEIDAAIAAIGVNRVKVVSSPATGAVTIYYATPTGGVSGPNVALLNAKMWLRVVPIGVPFQGFSATAAITTVDYTAYLAENAGVDEDELEAMILSRFQAYFLTAQIGGFPQITPTPGYTGAVTISKTRGLITDAKVNGEKPVLDASHTLGGVTMFTESQVPILGAVTPQFEYLPPQEP